MPHHMSLKEHKKITLKKNTVFSFCFISVEFNCSMFFGRFFGIFCNFHIDLRMTIVGPKSFSPLHGMVGGIQNDQTTRFQVFFVKYGLRYS